MSSDVKYLNRAAAQTPMLRERIATSEDSKMNHNCISENLSHLFGSIGRIIGKHPWCFLLIPILLSITLFTGFLHVDVKISLEYLYTPINGRTLYSKELATELYPMNVSTYFDLGRMPRIGKFKILIITASDEGDIFRKSFMDEVLEIDNAICNVSVKSDGETWTYQDLCARKLGDCIKNEPRVIAESIDDIVNGTMKMKYPIYIDMNTYKFVFYGTILGGVEVDSDGYVDTAKAIRLMYYLDDSDEEHRERASLWEAKVSKYLEARIERDASVSWFSATSYKSELRKVSRTMTILLVVVLVIMIIFNFIICMTMKWVESKPWLSIAGFLCEILSSGAAWGLAIYCGAEFTSVIIFNIFLVISIGMNDTFILISAWRKTSRKASVDKRLEETYSTVFVPITVTFLVVLICSSVGTVIPFRAAQLFCTYAAINSVFLFLYEITFLGGCMAVSGYRENKNMNPIIVCRTMSSGSSTGNEKASKSKTDYFIANYFQEGYVSFLSNPFIKIIIALLYAAYLAIALWQCTKLQVTSGVSDVFPKHSYITSYYQKQFSYFMRYPQRVQLIVTTPLNYSDPIDQMKIENLLQTFENSTYVASSELTSCWLRNFLTFSKKFRSSWMLNSYDLSLEQEFLQAVQYVFLRFPMTYDLSTDVIFQDDTVVAMRCFVQTYNIVDAEKSKSMLEEFYRIAKESEIPFTFHSMLFPLFELSTIIKSIVLYTVPITFGVTFLVTAILVPNIVDALCNSLAVISVQVGVIGFLALWNVKINAFYTIIFVMIIGIMVNYTSHLTYAYVTASERTSKKKLLYAIKTGAIAVLQSCLVLVIASAFLMILGNKVSVIFYKILFMVLIFTCLHTLIVLPAVYAHISGITNRREELEVCQMESIDMKSDSEVDKS